MKTERDPSHFYMVLFVVVFFKKHGVPQVCTGNNHQVRIYRTTFILCNFITFNKGKSLNMKWHEGDLIFFPTLNPFTYKRTPKSEEKESFVRLEPFTASHCNTPRPCE